MKILVVGASGLVGSNLLKAARDLGHNATGTYHLHQESDLVHLDLNRKEAILGILAQCKPDAVFFCCGWSWVDGCESNPERARYENAVLPGYLAGIMAQRGIRFIYLSTSYVFDGKSGPYDETGLPNPLSVYGATKLEGENLVWRESVQSALLLRTMGVYGLESRRKNFVYQVRAALEKGQVLQVPNDQFGNVTYAPDLCRMALELVRREQSGIWNVAGPNPTVRRSEFAIKIAEEYALPSNLIQGVLTKNLSQAAARPTQGGLDIDKVIKFTGITPQEWSRIP